MIALDQAGRALVEGARVPPPEALAPWVEEGWMDRARGTSWMIVADDAPHLIYSETERPDGVVRRIMLVGARSRAVELDRSRRRLTIAVRLRPGAVPSLFGIAAHEIVDRSVPLGLLPVGAPDATELVERTEETASVEPLFAWLAGRLGSATSLDWRIRALPDPRDHGAFVTVPLSRMCRDLGISPRTFRKSFGDSVGLAPSTVLRIRRLQAALLHGLVGPEPWSRVAHRYGYADQSHLIRDCRDLLGETPERFRARSAVGPSRGAAMPIRSIGDAGAPRASHLAGPSPSLRRHR